MKDHNILSNKKMCYFPLFFYFYWKRDTLPWICFSIWSVILYCRSSPSQPNTWAGPRGTQQVSSKNQRLVIPNQHGIDQRWTSECLRAAAKFKPLKHTRCLFGMFHFEVKINLQYIKRGTGKIHSIEHAGSVPGKVHVGSKLTCFAC